MKVLLLGVGMQGKAALHDLCHNPLVTEVIAADRDKSAVERYVRERGYAKVTSAAVDAADQRSIDALFAEQPAVAVDLLPVDFLGAVARSAVRHEVHLVNTFYVVPEVEAASKDAGEKGVTILPEFGMDPGIDLVLLGEALRRMDTVSEVYSYGSGIPEPSAADNPLKYKITWTFDGVLRSYKRPSRVMRKGKVVDIPASEQFAPENVHIVSVAGLGELEAFPNGDATQYAEFVGDKTHLAEMHRYSCRWPGHAAFWKKMSDLGFLDDEPVDVGGSRVSPRRFVAALLTPQLQYKKDERDVAFLRVDVRGTKNGRREKVVFDVLDKKDLATGFTAMSRTVGFTASIGAGMILSGEVSKRGLASPVRDVPYEAFVAELARRGIAVNVSSGAWDA